ncbi:MAG: hypothetical protein DRR08_27025 [Candidatus Parabeggiatoa sp. nov. 2]|nr:MAG: hypothetical protein DRR08_27025 [Gammaproteobacteria bacterium]
MLLGSLLDSPAVVEMASQLGGKAVSIVNEHFTFTAYEVTGAYQDSYGYALAAIRLGVVAPEQSLLQQIRYVSLLSKLSCSICSLLFSSRGLRIWRVLKNKPLKIFSRFLSRKINFFKFNRLLMRI